MDIKIVNIAGLDVSISDETDGFGFNTCQEAVYIFNEFGQGRKYDNALECFCGPGYYGLGLWKSGIVKNISFSDIAPEAEEVMRMTFDENNIDFLQRYDLDPGAIVTWTYYIAPDAITPFVIDDYISLDQQSIPSGSYVVRPFVFVKQVQVPDELIESLGIFDTENISFDFLKMPVDMIEKSILIQ